MVDFLMMFSLYICVLSGVTLLIVHIWSKKKQKKEEAEDKTGGTVFHSGTRNVPKPIKERAGILQVLAPDGANTMPVSYMTTGLNFIMPVSISTSFQWRDGLPIALPGSSIWTMWSPRSS